MLTVAVVAPLFCMVASVVPSNLSSLLVKMVVVGAAPSWAGLRHVVEGRVVAWAEFLRGHCCCRLRFLAKALLELLYFLFSSDSLLRLLAKALLVFLVHFCCTRGCWREGRRLLFCNKLVWLCCTRLPPMVFE